MCWWASVCLQSFLLLSIYDLVMLYMANASSGFILSFKIINIIVIFHLYSLFPCLPIFSSVFYILYKEVMF